MRGAGEAVVADDAIGDEVARARRDVVEAHHYAEWADVHDAQFRARLERVARDRPLARDGGVRADEEAHPLGQAAADADVGQTVAARARLDRIVEAETSDTCPDPGQDLGIRIGDPDRVVGARALSVEDARDETLDPGHARQDRPLDELRDELDARTRLRADRMDFSLVACGGGEH